MGCESFWEVAICPLLVARGSPWLPWAHTCSVDPTAGCPAHAAHDSSRRQPGAQSHCPAAVHGDAHWSHFRRVLAASQSTEVGSRPTCWMGPVSGKEAVVPGGDSLVYFQWQRQAVPALPCSSTGATWSQQTPGSRLPPPPALGLSPPPAGRCRWPRCTAGLRAVQRSLRRGHSTQRPAR